MNLIVKEYLGSNIEFRMKDGNVYANATKMCKVFGKHLKHWMANSSTKSMIAEVSSEVGKITSELVIVKRGGKHSDQGSWIHEELIIELAGWLDVKFRRWCQKQIATLLRDGQVSLKPKSALELAKEQVLLLENIERLELDNKEKATKILEDAPRVEFSKAIEGSADDILVRDLSKLLANDSIKMGGNKLYAWLRKNGYVMKSSTEPMQATVERGLMRVHEYTVRSVYGDKICRTTKVTGKGQVFFLGKIKESLKEVIL